MADLKISQLNSLAGPSLDSTDLLAVVDVSASETKKITSVELVRYGYGFIPSASLDGDIIEAATTAARGTVQLTDSTGSTSITTAATPNAVKTAYDLANAALPKTGGTMTGQILGDDSTSPATPGFAFDGDADTGMVRLGVNELALATGGVARITLDASGNVVIPGNFTVQGTTTTIDTTTLVVKDKNIEMGAVGTPTDITADGGGITLKGTTDKTINWLDATDAWTLSEHVNIASTKEYRIAGTKVLDATSLGSGVTGSSLTSVGTIGTGTWQGTAVGTAYGGTGYAGGFASGELLIGTSGGGLAKATLTASTGVTITNGNGSITISATGSGGTVTGVTATSPLASSGGTAPDISIQDGTTSQKGAVQLEDSTSSTSTTKAATPASVKSAYDLANAALPKAGGTMTGTITFAAGQTISGYLATGDIGTTVQGYDADTAKTDVAQSFTAAQRGSITALTDGATITPDFALANNYSVTLGGNRTLANPTNLTAGQSGCIWITQSTGSHTLAYGSQWDFTGGTAPTLTTAASSVDCLVYAVQSSTRITATLVTNLS